jgi:hypothetical protein
MSAIVARLSTMYIYIYIYIYMLSSAKRRTDSVELIMAAFNQSQNGRVNTHTSSSRYCTYFAAIMLAEFHIIVSIVLAQVSLQKA